MSDQKKRALKQVQPYADYQRTFATDHGRRVLLDLMKEHKIMEPLVAGELDPLEMSFAEGQRNVVLRIMQYLKMDTEEMLRAIEEQVRNEQEA